MCIHVALQRKEGRLVKQHVKNKNMGKSKKTKVTKSASEGGDKFVPLADQILDDKSVKTTGRVKVRNRKEKDDEVNLL